MVKAILSIITIIGMLFGASNHRLVDFVGENLSVYLPFAFVTWAGTTLASFVTGVTAIFQLISIVIGTGVAALTFVSMFKKLFPVAYKSIERKIIKACEDDKPETPPHNEE